jgi:Flp pilus assembly protein TadD
MLDANKSTEDYIRVILSTAEAGQHHQIGSLAVEAIASVGGSVELHSALGIAYQDHAGKPEMAQQHFELALDLEPENPVLLNNLGISLTAQGEFQGAIESFKRAISVDKDYENAHLNLAVPLLNSGNYKEAYLHLSAAMRDFPALRSSQQAQDMLSYAKEQLT